MTSLEQPQQGKSAARQIVAQMNAGVLTASELQRLMTFVVEGFEQVLPDAPPPPPPVRGPFTVIRGDRP